MSKRYNIEYPLPLAGMKNLRSMVAGENRVFAAGVRKPSGMFGGASNASRAAHFCGMEITQRTMLIVDPVTYKSYPVILIHCVKPASPPKKKGRKAGGKNRKPAEKVVSLDEEGVVLYRGT